ncbi:MAG TPA: alpha/beta hydrolase [Solirubrobacterales bacterium]|nr:alpha/beta hydrolase [Solirubrobacterales bacterium]
MGSIPAGEIELGGRSLAWRTVGGGPPLLLINGYAATGEDWDPSFLEALGKSFEMICPDNRGVGGSGLGDLELSVDGMAADMESLLDALEIERAPVVGWSMGGFVAQRLTARAPERVAALALLATDPGGPDSVSADPEIWAQLVDHTGSDREQASRLISLLFPPSLAADIDRQFGAIVAAARASLSPQVLRMQEAAMDAWHQDGSFPSDDGVPPPTLVIHGELDQVIPPANAEPLAARWPGAQIEVFPGCGHALMAQQPQRIADLIRTLALD